MSVEGIIKGITALAGVLLVLAVGLDAMAVTLPGSVALLAVAGALAILAPTLAFLGTLKWSTIFKGLAAIALALVTIGVVGVVAAPALVAIGLALIPLGIGFATVAGAAYLFAKALALLGDQGQKGVAVMIAAFTGFVALIPTIVINFIKGMVGIAQAVADVAPKVLIALGAMLDTIIAFVITEAPKLALAIGALVDAIVQVLVADAPKLIVAGLALLQNLLNGIVSNIGQITAKVAVIITTFLTSLASHAPQLVAAGVNLLVQFIKGITNHISALVITVGTLIAAFIGAVAAQIPKIVASATKLITNFIGAISASLGKIIKAGTSLILNFLDGVASAIPKIISKGVEVIGRFLTGISSGLVSLENKGADAVISFLNGTAAAIRTKGPQLRAAGWNVASAMIDGIWQGIHDLGHRVADALGELIRLLPKKAREILGIASPSKVFAEIGGFMMQGMTVGISDGAKDTQRGMASAANDLVDTAKSSLGQVPGALAGMLDMQPTITPVLDLSQVERDAPKLGALTSTGPIPVTATISNEHASAILANKQAWDDQAAARAAQAGNTFNFTQNNTSPKSLSEIEIYRQTNNQLSQIKSLVGVP